MLLHALTMAKKNQNYFLFVEWNFLFFSLRTLRLCVKFFVFCAKPSQLT